VVAFVNKGKWEAKSEAEFIWRMRAKIKYSAETFFKKILKGVTA
jgi:hypothetical protein